jgi:hypothetical protein
METSIELALGNDCRIELDQLARERPGSDDYWDGNWVRGRARYSISGWQGGPVQVQLHVSEIAALKANFEALDRELRAGAKVEFIPMEPYFFFALHIGSLGQMSIKGKVQHGCGVGTALLFETESDQTFLTSLIEQTALFIKNFGIVGTPPKAK